MRPNHFFHKAGWRVFTVARGMPQGEAPWVADGGGHFTIDVGDVEQLERNLAPVKIALRGSLHALVNNAGISPKKPGGYRIGVLDNDLSTWLQVFNINLFSKALVTRHLFDEIKAARGAVVNLTSIAGSRVHPFAGVAYACSKAALYALTREMAAEFACHGVRANAVAPGEIDTSILSPGTASIVDTQIPMRRLGTIDEVASTIMFLCGGASSYITGAQLDINGGQHV